MYSKSEKSDSVTFWLVFLLLVGSKSGAKPTFEKIVRLKTWCTENNTCKYCPKNTLEICSIKYSSTFLRGEPGRDQVEDGIGIGMDRMMELDKVHIILGLMVTNSPVIFRSQKSAFYDRGVNNVRKRGIDKEAKYGSSQFDFEDKRLPQASVADIHLLTDATPSLSRVLFTTQSPERQNYQTVLIKEENEFLDDDFENIVCAQLNGTEYNLIYKKKFLDELNLLLSTLKMTSAEDHKEKEYMSSEAAKILYYLFKYYLEQTSLFQRLEFQFRCTLLQEERDFDSDFRSSYSLIARNKTEVQPVFKNFTFRPSLRNSDSHVQRRKRENEDSSIEKSEIKFSVPKSIQDILKYIKTSKDDLAPNPRISETTKMVNENEYINSANPTIESELNLGSKSKVILKSDFKSESFNKTNSEDTRSNELKNQNVNEKTSRIHLRTSDRDAQNNNLTLNIFKDFVNDSIVSFRDQLKKIEEQIGRVERKLGGVKTCESDRDLNGNVFSSSSVKLQRTEETNDINRSSKKLSRVNQVLNHEKLIKEFLERNNLKGKRRVSEIETGSKISAGKASLRKESFTEEIPSVNVANYQRKSSRKSNSTNSPNIYRYFGSSEKLFGNEALRRDPVTRSQGLLRNDEESGSRGTSVNQELLRYRGMSRNQELLGDQKRWRGLHYKERDGASRTVEEGLRFAKVVSDLRNLRHRRIDYNPEKSLFYLDNLKEIPRFVEPLRQLRKRDSLNQDSSDNSDPLRSNLFFNIASKDSFRTRLSTHANPNSWKMFIARKDPGFSRRIQLQRTKSSPSGFILPLNQEEKSKYQENLKEVIRQPSLSDYLDYPEGQVYATLGGKLSWDSDRSRLLNDLTLNESHSLSVDQLDKRNNYSSGIEDNGAFFPPTAIRSSLMESLEMEKINLTALKRNETHHNQDFNKDLDKTDILEKRKILRSNSTPRSKISIQRVWPSSEEHRKSLEEMRESMGFRGVSDFHYGFFTKEDSFNSKNEKK